MNILRDRRRRKVPGRGQLRGGGSHDNGPFGLAKNHLAINKSGDGGGGFPFLKKKVLSDDDDEAPSSAFPPPQEKKIPRMENEEIEKKTTAKKRISPPSLLVGKLYCPVQCHHGTDKAANLLVPIFSQKSTKLGDRYFVTYSAWTFH